MKNIKNIDRLFQEKFKDFDRKPDDEVWKNIEVALAKQKRKKRIFPFWYKISGVAAGLLIALLLVNNNFSWKKEQFQNTVVKSKQEVINKIATESSGKVVVNKKIENNNPSNSKANNSVIVQSEKNVVDLKIENRSKKDGSADNTVANSEKNVPSNSNKSKVGAIPGSKLIVGASKPKDKKVVPSQKLVISAKVQNTAIVNAYNSNIKSRNKPKSRKAFTNPQEEIFTQSINNGITTVTTKSDKSDNPNSVSKNNTNSDIFTSEKKSVVGILDATNGSIKDATMKQSIAEKTTIANNSPNEIATKAQSIKTDTIALVSKTLNPLEELLQKKETTKLKNVSKVNKWQVTSSVAPVFFNSNSKDSPIDPALNSYNKTFETNLSLGIGVGYAISKKLSIRSGVNKFVMSYATNEVFFRAGLGKPAAMQNMTSANNGAGLEIVNKAAIFNPSSAAEIAQQTVSEGAIAQRMGYLEVPVELSYAVLNKKFSIDLIGGFSTLFLSENEISMQSNNMTSTLGQANNLNNVHFSSNFGVGFRYQFWKSFQAKLEPTFKYQINTFSDNSTAFRPYFIGVYSGISFGF